MQNLLGVVLCGGESKRMGTDKGLMPYKGTIRAKYVAQKLSSLNIPVVFSVNESQLMLYAIHIPADQLIVDSIGVEGPLKGLLSVHAFFPENDLLLLACDMLDLDVHTIQQIITIRQTNPGSDFYVYQDEKYAQPFCGIYSPNRLSELLLQAQKNALTRFSMQKVLEDAITKRIPISNAAAFKNYNTEAN